MKQALNNPGLGIKVIDVREAEDQTAKYANHAKGKSAKRKIPPFSNPFRVFGVFRG